MRLDRQQINEVVVMRLDRQQINEVVVMRLDRQQIKETMGLDRRSDTFYVVDFQQQMEFWDWCTERGVEVRYEGTWTDRPVFRVIHDPCPAFTALRWS